MNESILKFLSDMASFEDFNGRTFPAKAYRNAVKTISGLDFEIDDADQVKDLPGIGSGIYKKIQSWLESGTFERYEAYKASPVARIKEMAEIKGIGMAKAKKLYENGIQSLDQLRAATRGLRAGDKIQGTQEAVTFTSAMKIGLEYEAHTDKTRMPISEHDAIVAPMIAAIQEMPSVCQVSAAGSARRYDGTQGYTVGDVDLIVGVDGTPTTELRQDIEGLLDEVIMSGPTKISGIKSRRQVDVRMVDNRDFGALLLHATGPAIFNVACRKIAISHGWTLNEYGLFDTATKQCLSKDEHQILDLLGIGWIEPSERKNFIQ